jgi:hypothetical protein
MGHHNVWVKEQLLALLGEQKIEHLILSARRDFGKHSNVRKDLAPKTDITVRNHRNQARLSSRQEFVKLDQIAGRANWTRWGAIADCAANGSVVALCMPSQEASKPVWWHDTVLIGNRDQIGLGPRHAKIPGRRLVCLSVEPEHVNRRKITLDALCGAVG